MMFIRKIKSISMNKINKLSIPSFICWEIDNPLYLKGVKSEKIPGVSFLLENWEVKY
jgi:hypothetical protein